ncbi:MAG: hypothetical protein MPJ50_08565, partial [Pirellulales bacterium]|nr:hypothetical protein [Pirellulales bacterium]
MIGVLFVGGPHRSLARDGIAVALVFPRALPSRVRAKLTLVKFFHPPGGWRKRVTPMQWTSNG